MTAPWFALALFCDEAIRLKFASETIETAGFFQITTPLLWPSFIYTHGRAYTTMSSSYDSGYDAKYGYNRNAFAHGTLGTAVMGKVVKLLVTPIGLVGEALQSRKDKRSPSDPNKHASASVPRTIDEKDPGSSESQTKGEDAIYVHVPSEVAGELIASGQAEPTDAEKPTHELLPEQAEDDNESPDAVDWALDEAAAEIEEEKVTDDDSGKAVTPTTSKPATSKQLPFPIVIPQRRPNTKSRGFIRAYPPILESKDISSDLFLGFLKEFHTAAQASPIFNVVMIATAIAGAYPDPLVGLGVQAVQVAAGIGQEVQERYRINRFLSEANRDIFKPRGLYAMVIMSQPGEGTQPEVATRQVDLGAQAVIKYEDNNKGSQKLRQASGKTFENEMPVTCAPLIFPALDRALEYSLKEKSGNVAEGFKANAKSSSKFVSDYFDRRAQASYAFNNPDSTLTAQVAPVAPTFKSKYADPNDQTNKHFFTLITGGRWKAEPLGARRRYERAKRKEKGSKGIQKQAQRRILSESVLYLMVVNMPTEEDLAHARDTMALA
ncbi:MAG: hypothetical protein Q9168_004122 [Polycauliona sp. 1 TL-2023]